MLATLLRPEATVYQLRFVPARICHFRRDRQLASLGPSAL
jgi:hypothetical protein